MRVGKSVVGAMLVGVLALPVAPARARNQALRVDATGATCPDATFTRIQDAINAASSGATITVCAGTYPEQLLIGKRLTIVGTGGPVVRPGALTQTTSSLRTARRIATAAVVTVPATIDGLEFDLAGNGLTGCENADPLLVGVYFRGTSGVLKNSRIHDVRHPAPASACDSGAAVLVQGDGVRPIRVTVSGNTIQDYQRAGIVVNEGRVRSVIRDNSVIGAGVTSSLVQNGIQVGFGATATISNNVVQDNAGPSGSICTFDGGNLSFMANGGRIQGNTFRGNTVGVIVNGSRNRVIGNMVEGRSGDVALGLDGIAVTGDRNLVTANTVRDMSEVGIRLNGSRNVAKRNVISDTHEAALCAATRALPGCADVLGVCGVGLWITGGSHNVDSHNQLSGNDTDLRDEALHTASTP